MAYSDFPSRRDKIAMEFYKRKYKDLSDEEKYDVQSALKASKLSRILVG